MRLILAILLMILVGRAAAVEAAGFSAAVQAAPEVVAARARAEGQTSRQRAAGALDNPLLRLEGMQTRMDGRRRLGWEAGVEQMLPAWGARDAARRLARARREMGEADLALVEGAVAAELAAELVRLGKAQEEGVILGGLRRQLESLTSALATRAGTGGSRLAETADLASRVALVDTELAMATSFHDEATSAARGRLGLAAEAPLPALLLPEIDMIAGRLSAEAVLAQTRQREAAAMLADASSRRRSTSTLGLSYGRDDEEQTITAMFSLSLPVQQRAAGAEEDAARADRRAAEADLAAAIAATTVIIDRARIQQRLVAELRRLTTANRQRLTAQRESLLKDLGTAEGPTLTALFDLIERDSSLERTLLAAETEARLAQAALWRLLPPSQLSTPARSP